MIRVRAAPFALALAVSASVASPALAQPVPDQFLCCTFGPDLNAAPCFPSPTACAAAPYLLQFADLPDNAAAQGFFGPSAAPDVLDASFPPGMDGTAWWQSGAPWEGVCMLAPSASDPMHEDPTEPVGCFDFALWPGLGAEELTVTLQADGRFDAYQLCYGASAGGACTSATDDPTVSPLPASGSCCAPANMLRNTTPAGQWLVSLATIPGVPEPDMAGEAGAIPHTVVTSGAGPTCQPKTCASTGLTCANVDDGCGGTLSCRQGCESLAQACAAAPGEGGDPTAPFALVSAIVAASLWRRRRPA